MGEGLPWPPKEEDLERLYLIEKLSAAKIAKVYGLKYKSPKVAESVVLYHLKRNEIKRRDPAEHIRRVSEEMIDEWVRRYRAGDSLEETAGTTVNPVTVWNHLKKGGVVLRDKVEAQIKAVTKYEKKPFNGDGVEKAYLMGLRYGDLDSVRHGRAVRVRVSTTHPAMAELFESLFSPHGHVHWYPREAEFTSYEWSIECDLDSSFGFLLKKSNIEELRKLSDPEFIAFTAGFFDAEGSIFLHEKSSGFAPEANIANTDEAILRLFEVRLTNLGISSKLTRWNQYSKRLQFKSVSILWKLNYLAVRFSQEVDCYVTN